MHERQLANGQEGSAWRPNVVLEGRVRRLIGPLLAGGDGNRYAEMYVHDAMSGNHTEGPELDEPCIVAATNGRVVLPNNASEAERSRVRQLFDLIFHYVRRCNSYVSSFVSAAEDLLNGRESDIDHFVIVVRGKDKEENVRKRARDERAQVGNRSPFAVAAGQHGRLGGAAEVCVLCPRTLAYDEKSVIVMQRRGGGLQELPIEHRSFDALYHVLIHPTGYNGWEDNYPFRSWRDIRETLPPSAIEGAPPRGSSAHQPRSKMSMRDYYAYRLHPRCGADRTDNCMFMMNRAFQEYACVAFWRVETARLNYHRMGQALMRAARATELRRFAQAQAQGEFTHEIGRVSYIPESFVGGPSDMYANYLDAMAMVLHHGAGSLFVTFTANPKWPELLTSLPFCQTASERADLIARLFKIKLDDLLTDLKSMLGEQVGCIYTVEFQKRGLPHAHIVVILRATDRPLTGADINALSSAELPPEPAADDTSEEAEVQRRLRALVLEHMLHNDCSGPNGRRCPCWDEAKQRCSGDFPFEFVETTSMGNERQKVKYRRRRGSAWTANHKGRVVTNQWIVPYCACLLLKYGCHLNVEVVTTAYSIKYLFKYVFKGADNASAAVHATRRIQDRIGHYQDHRYLGAAEAFWRLFGFDTRWRSDTVYRMAVALPEEREVRYREGEEEEAAERKQHPKHLEAFVLFCGSSERDLDEDTAWQSLTLTSFGTKYVFDKGVWQRRKKSDYALGRMYPVHPTRGDAFYLRTMLCSITGADVRELARTWDGAPNDVMLLKGEHATFKDACFAMGLLFDDAEWDHAMNEAAVTAMPRELRGLFIHIVCCCNPSTPAELFERHYDRMGDDIRRELEQRLRTITISHELLRSAVLYVVRSSLDPHTSNVESEALKKLPVLLPSEAAYIEQLFDSLENPLPHVYDYDPGAQATVFEHNYEACQKVGAQQELIDTVRAMQAEGAQILMFVDAPGGCGKTFCFNTILAYYRSIGKRALALATTGIAALQLHGGKTVHTGLKVAIDTSPGQNEMPPLTISRETKLGQFLLHEIDLLLWDEAAMAHRNVFESVDYHLRELRNDQRPFGGVNVILGGDFRQCLPVVPNGTREQQVAKSIKTSPRFDDFTQVQLHQNVRVSRLIDIDPGRATKLNAWAKTLLLLGSNAFGLPDTEVPFTSARPPNVNRKGVRTMEDVRSMIRDIFGDLAEASVQSIEDLAGSDLVRSAILCPLHESVDFINSCCLEEWEGDTTTKYSIDEYDDTTTNIMSTFAIRDLEHLYMQTPNGSPPHRLDLKPKMPVILLRNMANGLMNGTRMMVIETLPHVLRCLVLNGCQEGTTVFIPRFLFKHEGSEHPLPWCRRQFPVKPCWAMTINKAQGQTLNRVGVCLVRVIDDRNVEGTRSISVASAEAFSHGQVYVALGRCGDPDFSHMYTTYEQLEQDTIVNVVYPEALPMHIQRYGIEGLAVTRSLQGLCTMEEYFALLHTTGQDMQPTTDLCTLVDCIPDEHFHHAAPSFDCGNGYDVPYHGYVFDEGMEQWDGNIRSCRELAEADFIQGLLNDEFLDEFVSMDVVENHMNMD